MSYRLGLIPLIFFVTACDGDSSDPEAEYVSVSITLDNVPESITYNKSVTLEGHVEYSWSITFDTSGDGAINQGDVELQIIQFKSPGSIEKTGSITDLDASLWLYTTESSAQRVASAVSSVDGNTIVISIDKSVHESLGLIDDSTLVHFLSSTFDDNNGWSEYDYSPAYQVLQAIPNDGYFTDPQGDADFPYIDMVSMSITL